MGLQTTMSTALTGMTAAETSIDVVGNNVANANTVGFKSSSVSFATQFLQTQSIGSAPSTSRGGTNPRQTGLGVKVAEITPDFTPGTVEISSNPLDLAIQGDGFFIVQGPQGEQLYTRNGQFKTNANNEIVTMTGHRVLGYSVDANFQIQPTGLTPLQIPLGAAAVAKATTTISLNGGLNPNGKVGTQPGIIESNVLSDGRKEVPDGAAIDVNALTVPNVDLMQGTSSAVPGGLAAATPYEYRISFVDAAGYEGPASSAKTFATQAGETSIDLTSIPTPVPPGAFTHMRIYRSNPADPGPSGEFRLVAEELVSTSFLDDVSDAAIAGAEVLDETGLGNVSYSYYVTFYNTANPTQESRPTARLGPVTTEATSAPRIRLSDIPVPDDIGPEAGGYNAIRIYRNVSTDQTKFFRVGDFAAGSAPMTFIDNMPDTTAMTKEEVNLDGPAISNVVPLVKLVSRDGADYPFLFAEGDLTFTGSKGGRQLGSRTLAITSTTTVGELLTFMEEAMGVVEDAPESTFPTANYGGEVVESRLRFTSNMGEQNALGINLSAFQFTPAGGGDTETVALKFGKVQDANGEGATTDLTVYDSLGSPLRVRVTTVLEESSSTGATFRWIATSSDHIPDSGASTVIGTGTLTTGSDGKFVSASDDRIAIDRGDSPAASPLEVQLDFSAVTGLAGAVNKLNQGESDGFPAGTLTSFIITDAGRIQGLFSNGSTQDLGQIRMAMFANNSGLQQLGDNMFTTGVNSGLPSYGDPGSEGMGAVTAGAVELSNTDIGENLIELILASTQYRGGARVITAVQQLLDELLALRR
jgi:flagellar hook protein FlgE